MREHTPAERERLEEIATLRLGAADVCAVLDEVAGEAARRLGLPIGLVSIVLDDAQVFAASHGLAGWLAEAGGTPIEMSFCRHAVDAGAAFVVSDATAHPLVRENPLVTEDGIRCYAGIPLVSRGGHALGTLCVLGTETRVFDDAAMATLRELAAEAVERIEARRVEDPSPE